MTDRTKKGANMQKKDYIEFFGIKEKDKLAAIAKAKKDQEHATKEVARLNAQIQNLDKDVKEKRKILEGLIKGFDSLESEIESNAKESIESKSILADQVKKGEITIHEFWKNGKSKEEAARETRVKTSSELHDALRAIQKTDAELKGLEHERNKDILKRSHWEIFPTQIRKEIIDLHLKAIDAELDTIVHGRLEFKASTYDESKQVCEFLKGIPHSFNFGNLSFNEVKRLRFNALFRDYLEELDEMIAVIREKTEGENIMVTVTLKSKTNIRGKGLEYYITQRHDERRKPIITTDMIKDIHAKPKFSKSGLLDVTVHNAKSSKKIQKEVTEKNSKGGSPLAVTGKPLY